MFKQVFNNQPIVQALRGLQGQLVEMKPVYDAMGEQLVRSHKERFKTGSAPDGTAWAPKKAATIERYRRAGDGEYTQPLIGPSRRLGNEINYSSSSIGVEVGSNLEYAGTMQTGAAKGEFGNDARGRPIPWGFIPARVWLGLSDKDERDMLDIVEEHLALAD
jgi:phage virion morphogenesis protein